MSEKKPAPLSYLKLYAEPSSPEKKAVADLTQKINGLITQDPRNARKAALVIERWLRQKSR